jgi:hypothetical protein
LQSRLGPTLNSMRRPILVPVVVIAAFSLPTYAGQESGAEPNLHDRIMAADTFQYCRTSACSNPQVVAVENGYVVIAFPESERQFAYVRTNELADYLQALPEQAWPLGPRISLSQTAKITDRRAVKRSFRVALRVFRSLGLEVQIPSGIRLQDRRSQRNFLGF